MATPPSTYVVEVSMKPGLPDAAGAEFLGQLNELGTLRAEDVRVCRLYEITGRLNASQIHQISKELLSDPVTQDYRIGQTASLPAQTPACAWRVEIWRRAEVADPLGESLPKAFQDMDLPKPDRVRTGLSYRIAGRLRTQHLEKAVQRLLAHPSLHTAKVHPS